MKMKIKKKGFTQAPLSSKKGGAGFTLIELLVVIAVIGMLASIVLVSLGPARTRARDAKRQSDIRQIGTAMELYYDSVTPSTYLDLPNTATTIPAGSAISTFMTTVPSDPVNTGLNVYTWTDNNTPASKYCAWARLEAPSAVTWFVTSQNGVKTTTTQPTEVNCNTL